MSLNEIQSVEITLSDGSVHSFSGRVAVRKGDQRRISNIVFTEPEKLPTNIRFEKLSKLKEGQS